jgi:SAM-dependent methyltransferase
MMSDQDKSSDPISAAGGADSAPTCPVSHSTATTQLCNVDGFDIWRCAESATDFVWPMPSDQSLKEMYDREAYFEGGEHGGYANYDVQTEPSLHMVTELLDRFPESGRAHSVLDIGCSYGSHLRLAADRGWNCFGIELSEYARNRARERHGERMTIVERAEDLAPQCYDLVLMLEVIEHLKDPYPLFFTLFEKGAIGPETLVVITTPNARSNGAVANPGAWEFRHPPSHLVYYSGKTLQLFLERLMFKDIFVRGIVDLQPIPVSRFDDEAPSVNDDLGNSMGVCAEGIGSDFKEFMVEHYAAGSELTRLTTAQMEEHRSNEFKKLPIEHREQLEQQTRVHQLALKGREFLLEERERVIKERDSSLNELRAWVQTLNEGKEWLAQQAEQQTIVLQEQEAQLKQRDAALQEKDAALRESDETLAHLRGDIQDRENSIQGLQQQLTETRAWVEQLNESKEWLAVQNRNLENQLAEHQRKLHETEKRIDEILNSKAWRTMTFLRIAPKTE